MTLASNLDNILLLRSDGKVFVLGKNNFGKALQGNYFSELTELPLDKLVGKEARGKNPKGRKRKGEDHPPTMTKKFKVDNTNAQATPPAAPFFTGQYIPLNQQQPAFPPHTGFRRAAGNQNSSMPPWAQQAQQ